MIRNNSVLFFLYIITLLVFFILLGLMRNGFEDNIFITFLGVVVLFSVGIVYFLRLSKEREDLKPSLNEALDDFSSLDNNSNKDKSGITVLGVILILGSAVILFVSGLIIYMFIFQFVNDEDWLKHNRRSDGINLIVIFCFCILIFMLGILSLIAKIKILRKIHS